MAEGRATKRESSLQKFIGEGVDRGNNYFQLHALESDDGHAAARKPGRQAMRKLVAKTRPCRAGMEACGAAHDWARELQAMGHEVRLIPPIYVKPYVKRGKNDAAGAAAIEPQPCRGEAMRFVPVKSAENQSGIDAAQNARASDQAADHGRQRLAWSSFRIRQSPPRESDASAN